MRRMRTKRLLVIASMAIPAMLLFIAAGGALVMLLWNWLAPQIFDLREITFWQALGLLTLCRILFGGSGKHSAVGSTMRRRMEERWANITPEERERLRQRVRGGGDLGRTAGESEER